MEQKDDGTTDVAGLDLVPVDTTRLDVAVNVVGVDGVMFGLVLGAERVRFQGVRCSVPARLLG